MSASIKNGIETDELKVIEGYAQVEAKDKYDVDVLENSTNVPLSANQQFSGQWIECTAFRSLDLFQLSNVASAVGGLKIQFSNDGSNIDWSWDISTTANVPKNASIPLFGKFYRIIYVNGTTNQISFRINTRLSYKVIDLVNRVNDFIATGTAALNTATSATLPAAGIGTVHYITSIRIDKFATAVTTAGATPIISTAINLALNVNCSNKALPMGENEPVYQMVFDKPIKSTNANTNTLIGMPAVPLCICKITVTYFIGA